MEEVAPDAVYTSAHPGEHLAELLDIGFAGCVVDGGSALSHDGCHDDIGGAGDGRFVQQHIAAFQMSGFQVEEPFFGVIVELGSQLFKSDDMCIQAASSYLIASGFWNEC